MRIKLDENIPASSVALLRVLGHDADSVVEEGLAGRPDVPVWEATQEAERFFVTQDLDFSDLRQFVPGTHYGVLLLRLHHPTHVELQARSQVIFETGAVEDWSGCFVVATDRKIRVRRPSSPNE